MTGIFPCRICVPIALLLLWTGIATGVEPGGGRATRLLEEQQKIQRVKQGIEKQRSRLSATQAKEGSLTTELDRLNGRIQKGAEALAELEKSYAEHESLLVALEEESLHAREEKEAARQYVEKRLLAFYRLGPLGTMNLLFARETLPETLAFREYFNRMLHHDREAILRYREKIQAAESARLSLEQEKLALLAAIDRMKEEKEQLAAARTERMALLARVKNEKKLYQAALNELGKAANQLTKTLEGLKAEAAKKRQKKEVPDAGTGRQPKTTDLAARKGQLPPPVPGTVTTLFGRNSQGKFGLASVANGIDIKAPPGTEITAIHEGTVVFAGELRGYGKLLIIDHGRQYYSLVSRAAKFTKKEGDPVARGEVIGLVGGQEGLLGEEGIHFEIRKGSQAQDPLQWVNNARLKIQAAPRKKRD